jgi:hypothetical protein
VRGNFRHAHKRTTRGGGVGSKTMVLGAIQRKGKVKVKVISNTSIGLTRI